MADPKKARAAFAPWDRRELPGLVHRRGVGPAGRATTSGSRCACSRCSAAGWPPCPSSTSRCASARHCYHHAWHAELWHKRLPELREMNPERLTAAGQRRDRRLHRRHDRARGARAHHREARRRLPGADPAQDRGVHVPPQQHEHDHRRTDHPLAQVHPPGRVRGLARRRDADPVAHRDPGRGRPGGRATRPSSRS